MASSHRRRLSRKRTAAGASFRVTSSAVRARTLASGCGHASTAVGLAGMAACNARWRKPSRMRDESRRQRRVLLALRALPALVRMLNDLSAAACANVTSLHSCAGSSRTSRAHSASNSSRRGERMPRPLTATSCSDSSRKKWSSMTRSSPSGRSASSSSPSDKNAISSGSTSSGRSSTNVSKRLRSSHVSVGVFDWRKREAPRCRIARSSPSVSPRRIMLASPCADGCADGCVGVADASAPPGDVAGSSRSLNAATITGRAASSSSSSVRRYSSTIGFSCLLSGVWTRNARKAALMGSVPFASSSVRDGRSSSAACSRGCPSKSSRKSDRCERRYRRCDGKLPSSATARAGLCTCSRRSRSRAAAIAAWLPVDEMSGDAWKLLSRNAASRIWRAWWRCSDHSSAGASGGATTSTTRLCWNCIMPRAPHRPTCAAGPYVAQASGSSGPSSVGCGITPTRRPVVTA
eukprot:Unigene15129_Nuclearia_a/m.45299 Unigene15129_Nuclearia_a/g.45299  ORF Unigene15129_Nuclearia_a/g.45299 Unigene15129_Nuclearia_a/m.45299 type:complete len:464 (+) Unigene15129_Nuclearia_a:305-1696(+)